MSKTKRRCDELQAMREADARDILYEMKKNSKEEDDSSPFFVDDSAQVEA